MRGKTFAWVATALMLLATAMPSAASAATPAELAAAKRYVEGIYAKLTGDFDYRSARYAPALKVLRGSQTPESLLRLGSQMGTKSLTDWLQFPTPKQTP